MYIDIIYIYIYTHIRFPLIAGGGAAGIPRGGRRDHHLHGLGLGKRDSIHHHLLEPISETANVVESKRKLLYTTPSGWWWCIHPVSITRFSITRFSPGSGLLRNPFLHRWRLRFSRVWVRKDGNLLTETGCTHHTLWVVVVVYRIV